MIVGILRCLNHSLCALQLVVDSAFVTMKRFLPLSPLILHPVFACKGTQLNQFNQPFFMCRHQRVIPNGWRELKRRNGSTSPLVIARFVVILYFVWTFDVCDTFRYNAHRDNRQMNTCFKRRFCAGRWGSLSFENVAILSHPFSQN